MNPDRYRRGRDNTPGTPAPEGFLSARDLRGRGWTERSIAAFLGTPDSTCPNPHGGDAPMRLWLPAHVEAVEAAWRRRYGAGGAPRVCLACRTPAPATQRSPVCLVRLRHAAACRGALVLAEALAAQAPGRKGEVA